MLSNNASKAAQIRAINGTMAPAGDGMLGSGPSRSFMPTDDYATPYPVVGVITNTGPYGGEPDYTDSRYWVQLQYNYVSYDQSNGSNVAMNLQNASAGADIQLKTVQQIVIATNPQDVKNQSHSLAVGTEVTLLPVYLDAPNNVNSIPQLRWIIANSSNTQCFKVASLPSPISGVVPPWVVANTQSNGSTGTQNVSVGVIQAHSVGDTFYALSVGQLLVGGTPLLDNMNKSIGWMECGSMGSYFTVSLTQNGGSQGSAGTLCSYTYDVYERTGTTKLIGTLAPEKSRSVATTVTTPAAGGTIKGSAYLNSSGVWVLREANEIFGEVSC